MFVIAGHAPFAFALAAWGAHALGTSRQQALVIGLLAFGFAVVPDIDILHAVMGLIRSPPSDPFRANDAFWDVSRELHRGITHSLVISAPAAISFGFLRGSRPWQAVGVGLLALLVVLGTVVGDTLGFVMMSLFILSGLGVVLVARYVGVGFEGTFGAASVGLLTHPFGDLFTGSPPEILYPSSISLFSERVVLLSDQTLNLLAVFGLELAAIWLGLFVASRLYLVSLPTFIEPHAVLGVGYGSIAVVLSPPTLDVSEPFVFSVLPVGSIGGTALIRQFDRNTLARGFVTGLSAVTLAVGSYTVFYLVL